MGQFDENYLRHTPIATVWQDNRPVAFANVLLGAKRERASIDLMRFSADAPKGTMDFLFAQLLEWAKQQGFAQFSLGMCPLKDIAPDELADGVLWPRIAKLIRQHSEASYNFTGLRRYKEKWQPMWRPHYLIVRRRIDVLPALISAAAAIAGGRRKLFRMQRSG
jgi:phosphatidylglycerol lysyltransferase